jgi:hypothetical protein
MSTYTSEQGRAGHCATTEAPDSSWVAPYGDSVAPSSPDPGGSAAADLNRSGSAGLPVKPTRVRDRV